MRLKTTKRLLNLASLCALSAAGAVGYWGVTPVSSSASPAGNTLEHVAPSTVHETETPNNKASAPPIAAGLGGTSLSMNWERPLRRPLFDPPPPAPIVVVKPPPPPIRAKLLATVIESENSTAMIKLTNGQVVFHKVGEPLGADEPDAVIFKIETGSIWIRRGNEQLRLSVEGMNGK
jgi:hypothetical protein